METGTTRFEELKKEILIRAHKAEACREQYGRARYKAEFNAGKIWHNETRVTDGMLLLDNSSAELWGNSRAVLLGNSRAELRDNSSAVLRENSSAVLRDNSSAVLRDNSSAELWDNSYGMSYSIKECKLHDHAIYRIRETNEVRYVDENIRFVKVEEAES